MRKFQLFFSVLGCGSIALAAVGCALDVPGELDGVAGAGSGEPIGSTTEAAGTMQCKYENLKFYQFDTPLHQRMGTGTPQNTVCWLATVAGGPIEEKPDMSVTADANGWYLTGPMNQVTKGICAPLSCFYANEIPQDVKWASETYAVNGSDATGGAPFPPLGQCVSKTTMGWMADSAVIFQGIEMVSGSNSGSMWTTKDVAKTFQPESNRQYTSATYTDCVDDGESRKMFASNLFVGVPGGVHRPIFMGPLSSHSYGPTGAGEYVAKSWDSSHYTEMRWVDDGICYLTSVSGNLNTAADGAEIFPVFKQTDNKYKWVLRAEKLSGGNNSTYGVKATARCYKFRQTQI